MTQMQYEYYNITYNNTHKGQLVQRYIATRQIGYTVGQQLYARTEQKYKA